MANLRRTDQSTPPVWPGVAGRPISSGAARSAALRRSHRSLALLGLFAVVALVLSVHLGLSASAGRVGGCGADGACAALSGTIWGTWFGVPIAWLGVALYAVMLLLLLGLWAKRTRWLGGWIALVVLGTCAGAAALWFVALQELVIHQRCVYCMLVHACSVLVAALSVRIGWMQLRAHSQVHAAPVGRDHTRQFVAALVLGCASLAVLIVGQLVSPTASFAVSKVGPIHVDSPNQGMTRTIRLPGIDTPLRVGDDPLIGSPQAPNIAVLMFDYLCGVCRSHDQDIWDLVDRLDGELAVVLLLVPMQRPCNPIVPESAAGKPGACDLSRLAMAVWRSSPDRFPEFHKSLMSCPDPMLLRNPYYDCVVAVPIAGRKAAYLVGTQVAGQALTDPDIDELLARNARAWSSLPNTYRHIPAFVLGDSVLEGEFNLEALYQFVQQHTINSTPGEPDHEASSRSHVVDGASG